MVVCELAACITVAVLRSEVQSAVKENMKQSMTQYGKNESLVTATWDDMQQEVTIMLLKKYCVCFYSDHDLLFTNGIFLLSN